MRAISIFDYIPLQASYKISNIVPKKYHEKNIHHKRDNKINFLYMCRPYFGDSFFSLFCRFFLPGGGLSKSHVLPCG